jgi:hypothetical protein
MHKRFKICCFALLLAMQLLAGCVKNPVGIYYDPNYPKTLFRSLTILTDNFDGNVVQRLRAVQCRLISPYQMHDQDGKTITAASSCVISFSSDSQVHIRNGKRTHVPQKVVSVISKCFPEDKAELKDVELFQSETVPPTESWGVFITRTEELWLVYNKKTDHYFFFQNADPDSCDCVKAPESRQLKPWD